MTVPDPIPDVVSTRTIIVDHSFDPTSRLYRLAYATEVETISTTWIENLDYDPAAAQLAQATGRTYNIPEYTATTFTSTEQIDIQDVLWDGADPKWNNQDDTSIVATQRSEVRAAINSRQTRADAGTDKRHPSKKPKSFGGEGEEL